MRCGSLWVDWLCSTGADTHRNKQSDIERGLGMSLKPGCSGGDQLLVHRPCLSATAGGIPFIKRTD